VNQRVQQLKKEVLKANLDLNKYGLVILTWGNVSAIDRESGLVVIKASGIEYDEMREEHMTVTDLDGNIVEGKYKPSSDLQTHLVLYKESPVIGSIVHTHSQFATIWSQSGKEIPCFGGTHADHFCGAIPVTRKMTPEEINGEYEENTGHVIVERFKDLDYDKMRAVLIINHAPFTWGATPADAVQNSVVLEYAAKMAYCNVEMAEGKPNFMQPELMLKHYNRKNGKDAYYGQKK